MTVLDTAPADVVAFWAAAGPDCWFARNDGFDKRFRRRFLAAHEAAAQRQLDPWAATPEGGLALMILLDQFPRNAFRGMPRAWATDPQAKSIAEAMVARGHDQALDPAMRLFVYLAFSHSERPQDQERAVALISALGGEPVDHALQHRDIIRRFGRFPHRNEALGRQSTPEEEAFLAGGGFAG